MFQFYDSPIKSARLAYVNTCTAHGFNSMIVRLKVMIRPNGRGQFEGFNSMIVRLKDYTTRTTLFASIRRFNSMIVRLKGRREPNRPRRAGGFQFYDSPIKRNVCARKRFIILQFQFYDSPIKSLLIQE